MLTPYLLFQRVQFLRQCLGWDLSADAPTIAPPPAVLTIMPQPCTTPRAFTFQITHNIPQPDGYLLRFDITDAMPSVGRTPRETELRMICHTGPDSFQPLQHSGAQYTIPNARFAIPPGSRYALGVTILTPEVVPGPPLLADLIR
jgi:hypothetical protein